MEDKDHSIIDFHLKSINGFGSKYPSDLKRVPNPAIGNKIFIRKDYNNFFNTNKFALNCQLCST